MDGERGFEDLVPSWTFRVRSVAGRLGVVLVACAVVVAPLWLAARPAQMRLAPLVVLGLVAVAAVAGSWATALACAIALPSYWYQSVSPTGSFRLDSAASAVSVLAMAVLMVGLVLLTRSVERAVADVRDLDHRRRGLVEHATAARGDAQREADQALAALALSNALGGFDTSVAVAEGALAELRVPAAPSTASVAVVRDGHLQMLASVGADPRSLRMLERVDLSEQPWIVQVLEGEPDFVDDRERFAREHPGAGVLRLYPSGSWAAIPFRAEGTVGLLSLHYWEPQDLTGHSTYFRLVADALANNLRRAEATEAREQHLADLRRALADLEVSLAERDRIARTLSTTLLPSKLPALPGFSSAAWLVPASPDEVAGDFYDLFASSEGGWIGVLGDVCGKGAEAAAVTSLARYAARVASLDQGDPARVATVAHEALMADTSDLFCTMALVRWLPGSDAVDVTLAGHHQVRMVGPDGVERVGTFGTPLGLGEKPYTVVRHPLRGGEAAVLFSDGLVERTDEFGEDELDAFLATLAGRPAAEIAAALRERVLALPMDRRDDLTALVIRRD